MQVWQIAGGEPRRNFSGLFLRHDVMFLGPGRFGPYETPHYTELVRTGIEKDSQIRQVRHFAEHPAPGDVVLLRLGNRVKALGLIPNEGYFWSDTFDDIYGWDLQHARRVIWQDQLTADLNAMQEQAGFFAGVNLMPTFTAINKPEYLERITPLLSQCQSRKLRVLPTAPPPPLSIEALGHELFTRGIPNDLVDAVLLAIQHQRRLAQWYQTHGRSVGRPTEHEVVTYMILPLLLGLGWSEQLLAIEWNRVDLSVFGARRLTRSIVR